MLIDDLFDRLVRRFRRSEQHQEFDDYSQDSSHIRSRKPGDDRRGGFFKGAGNFVVHHSTLIEDRRQIIQTFVAGKAVLDPVLELILPYTDPDAAVDSSARFPPPLCHPGTRLKIGCRLDTWLADPERQWNMIWLHGPAGTGKSAVAQNFAERCVESRRLGASFFFSRPNKRNNPETVIPTLIYQLAVHNHDYKSLVTARLSNDPQLMRKARHIQFSKLIVEPLLRLQTQKRKRIQKPLLVVLDGLDECKGESAQREIIEMISEAMRLKKDLPLLWLICSRPEAHLKYIFSKADFPVNSGREELAIDAESIADVDLYIQDGLTGIRAHFEVVTTPTWPSQTQIAELSKRASGHFGFASTALRYIGDETSATPMARFDHLLSFLEGDSPKISNNPLMALDALYAGILRDVPDEVLPQVKQILGYSIFTHRLSAQLFCNFFRMDQATFYSALRKLHSVIDVPEPGAAIENRLRFYHASFSDYLRDPLRSGNFLSENDAWLNFAQMCVSWYEVDLERFHMTDGFKFDETHQHGVLPGLKWFSGGSGADVSFIMAREAALCFSWACRNADEWNDALLSQIRNFDFRYIWQDDYEWRGFVNKLWEVDSSSGFIRTEPQNETDLRLLEYMKIMTESAGDPLRPASFPLEVANHGDYFLLGRDSTAVVCWVPAPHYHLQFVIQSCDEAPSKERIDTYLALRRLDPGNGFAEASDQSTGEEENSDSD